MQYLLMLGYDLPHGAGTSLPIEKRQSKPQLGNQNGMEVLETRAIEDVEQSLMETEVHLNHITFLPGCDSSPQAFDFVLQIGEDLIWLSARSLQRSQFEQLPNFEQLVYVGRRQAWDDNAFVGSSGKQAFRDQRTSRFA